MKPVFPGFPPEGIQFLRDLEENNTREWFQPRKEHFDKYVKAPMTALVDALNPEITRFAPHHVSDSKKAIFRIYRDTRFSHDKTPYKNHIAAWFGRTGMEKLSAAGYYCSVNHKEVEIAGGVYHPDPAAMLTIRTHLSQHYEEFEALLANRKLRRLMGQLQGASLSRIPKGFDADHPAADVLKRKDWFFYVLLEPALATSPKLLQEIVARFEAVAPVVEYLNKPLRSKRAHAKTYQPLDRF